MVTDWSKSAFLLSQGQCCVQARASAASKRGPVLLPTDWRGSQYRDCERGDEPLGVVPVDTDREKRLSGPWVGSSESSAGSSTAHSMGSDSTSDC
jgi:hypothetical protein